MAGAARLPGGLEGKAIGISYALSARHQEPRALSTNSAYMAGLRCKLGAQVLAGLDGGIRAILSIDGRPKSGYELEELGIM